jgi:carbon-monoxide dehydrogenase medium subunit
VKSAAFDFVRATSIDDVVRLLATEDARVIAGGQSLLPVMAMRLGFPSLVVDVNSVAAMKTLAVEAGRLSCGAAVTQTAFYQAMTEHVPHAELFRALISHIGHDAIRNRGTIGGSICHADSSAEWPALVLVLGAEMQVAGPAGERVIPAEEFFVGPFMTVLEPGELLTHVHIPLTGFTTWGFYEVARRAGDFALAGCVVVADADRESVNEARVALFGCAGVPLRLRELEDLVAGRSWPDALQAVREFRFEHELAGDLHASSEARAHLARGAIRRALTSARDRTDQGEQR